MGTSPYPTYLLFLELTNFLVEFFIHTASEMPLTSKAKEFLSLVPATQQKTSLSSVLSTALKISSAVGELDRWDSNGPHR